MPAAAGTEDRGRGLIRDRHTIAGGDFPNSPLGLARRKFMGRFHADDAQRVQSSARMSIAIARSASRGRPYRHWPSAVELRRFERPTHVVDADGVPAHPAVAARFGDHLAMGLRPAARHVPGDPRPAL